MKDRDIRTALKKQLSTRYLKEPDTIIVEELGIRHGSARVDIVVINELLHGFEIKSDRDRLKRLPDQASIYNSVLDRITLVVGCRHVCEAMKIVPEWWGVKQAEMNQNGVVCLREIRDPQENPVRDIKAVVALLWRDEALGLLRELDAIKGVASKPRAALYERLVGICDDDYLRSRVLRQLKHRTGWLADEPRMLSDD